jgi:hypothetical protein
VLSKKNMDPKEPDTILPFKEDSLRRLRDAACNALFDFELWTDGSVIGRNVHEKYSAWGYNLYERDMLLDARGASAGPYACVYIAESLATLEGLQDLLHRLRTGRSTLDGARLLWATDSLSLLQALAKGVLEQTDWLPAQIWDVMLCLIREFNLSISCVFIFSHTGITRNDDADATANAAMQRLKDDACTPPEHRLGTWWNDAARERHKEFRAQMVKRTFDDFQTTLAGADSDDDTPDSNNNNNNNSNSLVNRSSQKLKYGAIAHQYYYRPAEEVTALDFNWDVEDRLGNGTWHHGNRSAKNVRLLSQLRTGVCHLIGGHRYDHSGDDLTCPKCGERNALGRGGASVEHLFTCTAMEEKRVEIFGGINCTPSLLWEEPDECCRYVRAYANLPDKMGHPEQQV